MATINGNTDAAQLIVAPTKHPLPPPKTVDSKSVLKRFHIHSYFFLFLVFPFPVTEFLQSCDIILLAKCYQIL